MGFVTGSYGAPRIFRFAISAKARTSWSRVINAIVVETALGDQCIGEPCATLAGDDPRAEPARTLPEGTRGFEQGGIFVSTDASCGGSFGSLKRSVSTMSRRPARRFHV